LLRAQRARREEVAGVSSAALNKSVPRPLPQAAPRPSLRSAAGLADEPTWRKLLGDAVFDAAASSSTSPAASAPSAASSSDSSSSNGGGAAEPPDTDADADAALAAFRAARGGGAAAAGGRAKWPTVMDMDGGREVHALQIALGRRGFFCGDDDCRWWMFGEPTMNALRTFQVGGGGGVGWGGGAVEGGGGGAERSLEACVCQGGR
jgi:hypothetical protein